MQGGPGPQTRDHGATRGPSPPEPTPGERIYPRAGLIRVTPGHPRDTAPARPGTRVSRTRDPAPHGKNKARTRQLRHGRRPKMTTESKDGWPSFVGAFPGGINFSGRSHMPQPAPLFLGSARALCSGECKGPLDPNPGPRSPTRRPPPEPTPGKRWISPASKFDPGNPRTPARHRPGHAPGPEFHGPGTPHLWKKQCKNQAT